MATKKFKAESQKLLDLMINSIYTNKEIFLRELISNASDAIDKLHFKGLTDESIGLSNKELSINISIDKDNRVLTISDNGIGMTQSELENNLGTIAKSGSLDFKRENKDDTLDIIGQFGVGFYSAFMVADNVTVISKALGEENAYEWESSGAEGYRILESERDEVGTTIILHIKPNTDTENYDEFLNQYQLKALIKKYSDYIRYPIKMLMTHSKMKDKPEDAGDDYKPEYEEVEELETLNSMVPIWKKKKGDVTEEEYNEFYKNTFYDYSDPLKSFSAGVEGAVTYNAVLFIPSQTPYDFYTKEYKKGLALYSAGVMIMEKCEDLLPDYFNFVRGIVDSSDLSLNISRELLQQNHQLKLIRKNIEKKIKNELAAMRDNDREKYEKFFSSFGRVIKFGIYNEYGANKDLLSDLLIYYSAKEKKMVTLDEYVASMPEDQKVIYFASSETTDRALKLPNTEIVLNHGYDVLLCTEDVDEFSIQIIQKYKDKEFKNVGNGDLGLESEEEKEAKKQSTEENKDLISKIKDVLKDKVKDVRLSSSMGEHPVTLTSDGPLSIEMEKVLKNMPGNDSIKSEKILEINEKHAIFETLKASIEDDEKIKSISNVLYNQALLVSGLVIEDPVEYSKAVCSLIK